MKKYAAGGFSLIELSIVMVIVGLLLSIGFSLMPNYLQSAKYSAARAQMKEIQNAIEGFAIANNRLPCPDIDSDGLENKTVSTNTICDAFGNTAGSRYDTADLPYRTLGLASNRDPWGRTIKYAVYMRTSGDTGDLATTAGTINRTNFCTKLTTALTNSQTANANPSTDIHVARISSTTNNDTYITNANSTCSTGTTVGTMEGTVMAYILASSGINNANKTNAAGYFDGRNNPGNSLCFESPDRKLLLLDSEQTSATVTNNYDDIVYTGSISGLISTLQCN
ncbi:MAG: type II secretion system protein [Magnetococcales bacterium]|nr:type II secretion system protein [Magnetococcales bacterium]